MPVRVTNLSLGLQQTTVGDFAPTGNVALAAGKTLSIGTSTVVDASLNHILRGSLGQGSVNCPALMLYDVPASGSEALYGGSAAQKDPRGLACMQTLTSRSGFCPRLRCSDTATSSIVFENPTSVLAEITGDKGMVVAKGGLCPSSSVDGGLNCGIRIWNPTNSDYGIYMASQGAGHQMSGGSACAALDGRTSLAVRNRMENNPAYSFVWENNSDTGSNCLMSLGADKGMLTAKGGICTGVNVDGGMNCGIRLWGPTDTSYGIYMAQQGVGRQMSTNTACQALDGRTGFAIRNRIQYQNTYSFIWETQNDDLNSCLMSLSADTGNLSVKGALNVNSGCINSPSGVNVYLGNGGVYRYYANAGSLGPLSDNAYKAGDSTLRWTTLYAVTGTINTSDSRDKTDVSPSALGLDFVNKLSPVSYRWKVGQNEVADDGTVTARPGTRTFYGLLAQDVRAALDEVKAGDFAGWTLADKADPDSQQGLRYTEFVAPLIKAVQELSSQVSSLRGEVAELRA